MLLTGATGFLGSRLCAELLRRREHEVVCLVRAGSAVEAESRVRGRLRRQDPDVAESPDLRCIPGDVAREFFGLEERSWRRLAAEVSEVFHCGASVNMAASYGELAPVNVGGTARVLEFCRAAGVGRLHHISTLAVFLGGRRAGLATVDEDTVPTAVTCSEVGYPRSKYEAENLVRAAADAGLAVRIYRPAVLLADSRDGACPADDFTARLLAAAVDTGAFPATGSILPVMAVDHAARLIAALSSMPATDGCSFPLMRPEPFDVAEFGRRLHAFGYPVELVSSARWQAALRAQGSRRSALAMRALTISRYVLGLDEASRLPQARSGATATAVADLGVEEPLMDAAYFSRMFTQLIEYGVLPPLPS